MNAVSSSNLTDSMSLLIERIKDRQNTIHEWLASYEGAKELPIYSSVDIRNAGFKTSVVDTNIFPAGFNNLCPHGLQDSVELIKKAIDQRVSNCRDILIIAEEHTRNTWYLENVRILQDIIEKAGYQVKIATFLTEQPDFCQETMSAEFDTAAGKKVRIFCFRNILEKYEVGLEKFDLIIMNNDLSAGIPDILKISNVPIYPSILAGWHSRLKSRHFSHVDDLMLEFSKIIDLDPWMVSSLHSVVDYVDINSEQDREKLKNAAEQLFSQIQSKYDEHNIQEKPYIVIKSDSGTYGMGVLAVEDPQELLDLNRKKRNKLHVGKSSRVTSRFLLQEGVPTIYNINQKVSEVCIYQIENNLIGGFYRSHSAKNSRENLNSKGMEFHTICPHSAKYGDCGVTSSPTMFDVYRILARIAGIAAHREIMTLEGKSV